MRIKTLAIVSALLSAPVGLAAQQATYLSLDTRAVSSYFAEQKRNLTCSSGTWVSGPNYGLTEHIVHSGPLGYCGHLSLGSGEYHIIAVTYYYRAGGTNVPRDTKYDGGDPRTTGWEDANTGRERQITDWKDVDGDKKLSQGDLVTDKDGATAPVEEVGTAAKVERATE